MIKISSDRSRLIYAVGAPFRAFIKLKREIYEEEQGTLHQNHGTTLWDVDVLPLNRPEGDGVFITAEGVSGEWKMRYADCAPVIIWCPGMNGWLMALHSGFWGTVQNIVAVSIGFARKKSPDTDLRSLKAWIGPNIGPCCYSRDIENDPKTQEALKCFVPPVVTLKGKRAFFDLAAQIKLQLMAEGISCQNIFSVKECTCCRRDIFYSYRAGDVTQRMTLILHRANWKV